MTDPELLAKKLAFVETCVNELRSMADPGRLDSDLREERFVVHTLQIAIQAVLDVGAHICAAERLGEPQSYREIFDLLVKHGWLPSTHAASLRNMAGFRNVVVHGYESVNLGVVREILESHLQDLLDFVAAIRERLRTD
mgnify:CR=1 FL=1